MSIIQKNKIISLIIFAFFWALMVLSESPILSISEDGPGALYSNILLVVLICTSFIAVLLFNDSFVRNFLIISLLLGIFFIVLRPFARSIDEEYHFFRSYELSLGKLFPSETGIIVPKGYTVYAEREKWNLTTIFDNPIWFKQVTENVEFPRIRSASYLFIEYIPGAVGIAIARLLRFPLFGIVLSGRLFYYLFFIGVCYLALKRTETLRSVVFLVALSGGTVLLYGVIQPDLVLISCCLLYVSICLHYCLDEVHETAIKRSDILLLAISALIIASIKYCDYILILLLVFFIPKNRYENKNRVIAAISICVGISVALQIYALLRYRGSLGDTPPGVDMLAQIRFMISHPIHALKVIGGDFLGNLFERVFHQRETSETAFDSLANFYALFPVLGAVLAQDRPRSSNKSNIKNIVLFCIIGYMIMQLTICISMYINWTPVGSSPVQGVHPRYSMPFFMLFLIPFSIIDLDNKISNWCSVLTIISALSLLNTAVCMF